MSPAAGIRADDIIAMRMQRASSLYGRHGALDPHFGRIYAAQWRLQQRNSGGVIATYSEFGTCDDGTAANCHRISPPSVERKD
jgi:hypothetical protein